MNKKIMSLVLSLGLVFGMGSAAFAETNPNVVNLLPYPNTQEFNQVVEYNPAQANSVTLRVQGADANYQPLNFNQDDALGVEFDGGDDLVAGTTTSVLENGTIFAKSIVDIPLGSTYGPKFVKATLGNYTPGSWTGMIDLGVILNPASDVSANNVKAHFFNGAPSNSTKLATVNNLSVTQSLMPSTIKYASAIDTAQAAINALGTANTEEYSISYDNNGTINAYVSSITIAGNIYEKQGFSQGWQYRVYDSHGNALKNCDKAGAEVFPVTNGVHVVWAYGSWGILGNTIDTALLQ